MPRRGQPKSRWRGELATTIKWTGPPLAPGPSLIDLLHPEAPSRGPSPAELARAYADVQQAEVRKLELLAREFGVELHQPGAVYCLLMRLARETVPGFQVEYSADKRGRPRLWSDSRYTELIADVEAVKLHRGCGDSEACNILVTSPKYRTRYRQDTGSADRRKRSLNARLVEAMNKPHFGAAALSADATPDQREVMRDVLIAHFALDTQLAQEARARLQERLKARDGEPDQESFTAIRPPE